MDASRSVIIIYFFFTLLCLLPYLLLLLPLIWSHLKKYVCHVFILCSWFSLSGEKYITRKRKLLQNKLDDWNWKNDDDDDFVECSFIIELDVTKK